MQTSVTPCLGARYNLDGCTYEIMSVTEKLVSLRDIEGKRARYFTPADFSLLLFNVEGEELQRGKMQEMIVDNGAEIANDQVKVAAEVLGIKLRIMPLNTLDVKPHVERFFKTMKDSCVQPAAYIPDGDHNS